MLRSLFSGVTGLNQNIVRLDVIGNNIANVNTVGYKTARITFGDAFSQTLRGGTIARANQGGVNPIQVGSGVQTQSITSNFRQGNLQSTGGSTDVAIQGSGFFVVNDGQQDLYTRAGTFVVDSLGRIVQAGTGHLVQGYAYDNETQQLATTLGEIRVPFGKTVAAHATEVLTHQGNLPLDSQAKATEFRWGAFDDANTSSAATASTLLTDLRQHGDMTPLLAAGDVITLNASIAGTPVSNTFAVGAGSTIGAIASFIETELSLPAGSVTFAADGSVQVSGDPSLGTAGAISELTLSAVDSGGAPNSAFNVVGSFAKTQEARDALEVVQESVIYDSLGEAHVMRVRYTRVNGELAWNWQAEFDGDPTILSGGSGRISYNADGTLAAFTYDDGSNGISINPGTGATSPQFISFDVGTVGDPGGMTLFAGTETVESKQDGYATGQFVDFAIDGSGRVFSLFSNGVTEAVGDFAIARFNNPTSLTKDGSNLYSASLSSGEPTVRSVGDLAGASLIVGAVEQSNVDLAQEFSEMIIAQRAFQANARVIQTSSDILAELMQISR